MTATSKWKRVPLPKDLARPASDDALLSPLEARLVKCDGCKKNRYSHNHLELAVNGGVAQIPAPIESRACFEFVLGRLTGKTYLPEEIAGIRTSLRLEVRALPNEFTNRERMVLKDKTSWPKLTQHGYAFTV